jgi:hypothetical protein
MAMFELDGAAARFLSSDDPVTAERWQQILDELPEETLALEGYFVDWERATD